MSELEQLRKEVNELRERVAKLEQRTTQMVPLQPMPLPGLPWSPAWPVHPDPITCGGPVK